MMCFHVEDGQAVATDGRRLHLAKLPRVTDRKKVDGNWIEEDKGPILPDGDYHVVMSKPKQVQVARITVMDQVFPNWKRVVPDDEPTSTKEWRPERMSDTGKFSIAYTHYLEFAGKKHILNMEYMSALCPISYSWTIELRERDSPAPRCVVFRSGDLKAVIMPMQDSW